MNSNSSLSSSSSLPSPACRSIPQLPVAVGPRVPTLQDELEYRMACIRMHSPEITVLVRQREATPILAGHQAHHADLLAATEYIAKFIPPESGWMLINGRSVRISWERAEGVVAMIAYTRDRSSIVRTFEKSIRRNLRMLVALAAQIESSGELG